MFELISVIPAFVRCSLEKRVYLSSVKKNQKLSEMISDFFYATDKYFDGIKITPGSYYTGIWCRDAAFILNELNNTGKKDSSVQWLERIWQNQIHPGQNVVHGRGSPAMDFKMTNATNEYLTKFAGSLPTSIQHNYVEIYAENPDIDSTALMVSTTCRILLEINSSEIIDKLLPKLEKAVHALEIRDTDDDLLLEQAQNEDWADNMLRAGKVVYSQAAWAMALRDWAAILEKIKKNKRSDYELDRYKQVIRQIDSKLWRDDSYSDNIQNNSAGLNEGNKQTITQDVSLFLSLREAEHTKALSTLEKIQKNLWKDGSSVSCFAPRNNTGPAKLKSYHYQNGGFWPWITSFEILARLYYDDADNCKIIIKRALPCAEIEWVNPDFKDGGAYPFRTGIAAMRTALREFSKANSI